MLRSVVVTAWLVTTCRFKINQMGSDLRTVVVGFWVSKWFWLLKKCGFLFSHLTLDVFGFWIFWVLFLSALPQSFCLSLSFTHSLSLKALCGGVNGGSEVNIFEGILGSEIRAPWRLCFWVDKWFSSMGRAGSFPFHLIFLYCFSFVFSSFKLFFLLFHIW